MGFQPWKVSRADVADGAAGRLWKGEMVMFLGSWAVGAGNFWEANALGAKSCPWNHIFWAHTFLLAWQTSWQCGALSWQGWCSTWRFAVSWVSRPDAAGARTICWCSFLCIFVPHDCHDMWMDVPGPYGSGKEDQIQSRSGCALADMVNFYDFTRWEENLWRGSKDFEVLGRPLVAIAIGIIGEFHYIHVSSRTCLLLISLALLYRGAEIFSLTIYWSSFCARKSVSSNYSHHSDFLVIPPRGLT